MEYVGAMRYGPVLDRIEELLNGKYQDCLYRRKISEAMQQKVNGKDAWCIAERLCRVLIRSLKCQIIVQVLHKGEYKWR